MRSVLQPHQLLSTLDNRQQFFLATTNKRSRSASQLSCLTLDSHFNLALRNTVTTIRKLQHKPTIECHITTVILASIPRLKFTNTGTTTDRSLFEKPRQRSSRRTWSKTLETKECIVCHGTPQNNDITYSTATSDTCMKCDTYFCTTCACSKDGSTPCCRGHETATFRTTANQEIKDTCLSCLYDPVCKVSGCNCSYLTGVKYCKLHYQLPNVLVPSRSAGTAGFRCLYCKETDRINAAFQNKKSKVVRNTEEQDQVMEIELEVEEENTKETSVYKVPHATADIVEQFMWRSVRRYLKNVVQQEYLGSQNGVKFWNKNYRGANNLFYQIGSKCGLANNRYGITSTEMGKCMMKWFLNKVPLHAFGQTTRFRRLPW